MKLFIEWRKFLHSLVALALLVGCMAPWAAQASAEEDFWVAIRNDRASQVKTLLGRGMDPNAVNDLSNTAMLEAIKEASWKVYDVLLADRRIDVNLKNRLGEAPLMYLAIRGETQRMAALIERGAQVNQPGWTALHYAAAMGHDDAIRLLIEHYAYIDAESPEKMTPLMIAARQNRFSSVKLLLDEGADGYFKDAKGKNAVDIARDAANTQLANDLVERLNHDRLRRQRR